MHDPELHPLGAFQVEHNAPNVEGLNFKYVLVSPMQRAMQTAIHMFKNHKNLDKIKFLVVPILREIMYTANDIHVDPAKLIEKYAPGQEICQGLEFDFSMIKIGDEPPDIYWCINTFTNYDVVDYFFKKLLPGLWDRAEEQEYRDVENILHNMVEQCLKARGRVETFEDIFERCKNIKTYLKKFKERVKL